MNGKLEVGVDCLPPSMLTCIGTNADIFWLHVEDDVDQSPILAAISTFSCGCNLRVVLTSGYLSELLHDKFDEVLLPLGNREPIILTAWSEDQFSATAWEFINVYGSDPSVRLARVLIVAGSAAVRRKLLAKAMSTILAG